MDSDRKLLTLPNLFAFSMSLGCILGWGAFVVPGTVLIPAAGVKGMVIGLLIATVFALFIGVNYIGLSRAFPRAISSYHMIKEVFGLDHAFFVIWSLIFGYVALIWGNSCAAGFIGRLFYGDYGESMPRYEVMGYEVYMADVLLSILLILAGAFIVSRGIRFTLKMITVLSLTMIISVVIMFIGVMSTVDPRTVFVPAFSSATSPPRWCGVMTVAVLGPWLFVGFEAISPVISDIRTKHSLAYSFGGFAILVGAAAYIMLGLMINTTVPDGFRFWEEYTVVSNGITNFSDLPAYYAVMEHMGPFGGVFLVVAFFCAVFGSIIGFMLAVSHTFLIVSKDRLIPRSLSVLNSRGVPVRALILLVCISIPFTFLGMNVAGWAVNLSTIGISIVYGYVSFALFLRGSRRGFRISGLVCAIITGIIFFLFIVPDTPFGNNLVEEEYLIFAIWCITGLACYRYVLSIDVKNRLGRTVAVWLIMFFLLFYSSSMWCREHLMEDIMLAKDSGDLSSILLSADLIRTIVFILAMFLLFELFSILLGRSRLLQEKLRDEKRKNRRMTALLAGMSHDIRTPMNAIIGYSRLALAEPRDPGQMADCLKKIDDSGAQLLMLLDDVFEMNNIESGSVEFVEETVNIPEVCQHIHYVLNERNGSGEREIVLDMNALENENVIFDRGRLTRILLSFIANAMRNTPDNGRIVFGAMQLLSAENGSAMYDFYVTNNGSGSQADYESFSDEQDHYTIEDTQGAELGLTIAKELIRLAGGHLEIESTPGVGTEAFITLELPVADEDMINEDGADLSILKGKRALIVDDIVVNRLIADAILGDCGIRTEEAEDGEEAFIRVSESLPGHFDFVLMDIQMPKLNGFDAARKIRELPDPAINSIPIFALTANVFNEDREKAYDSGMNGFVPKPIDSKYLINMLMDTFTEGK